MLFEVAEQHPSILYITFEVGYDAVRTRCLLFIRDIPVRYTKILLSKIFQTMFFCKVIGSSHEHNVFCYRELDTVLSFYKQGIKLTILKDSLDFFAFKFVTYSNKLRQVFIFSHIKDILLNIAIFTFIYTISNSVNLNTYPCDSIFEAVKTSGFNVYGCIHYILSPILSRQNSTPFIQSTSPLSALIISVYTSSMSF